MKLRQSATASNKLSGALRSWLTFLQSDLESLKENLDSAAKENPFVEIKSGSEVRQNNPKPKTKTAQNSNIAKNSVSSEIETLNFTKKSLYDILQEQIIPPLFKTNRSIRIAQLIIDNINQNGYFEANIKELAKESGEDESEIERIRKRFKYLEPSGVGAVDLYESFLFQLGDFDLQDGVYECCVRLIKDFENLNEYQNEPFFVDAIKIIKKFHNPPAIEFEDESVQIIPDIFIKISDDKVDVELNLPYYPEIAIDLGGIDDKFDFVKQKIKEAKLLVDALELRKATLMKIGLMIVEYQYDFFKGGAIKPMKLNDLAIELEHHHSTISRAISNKYISCDRGVFPIKSFFTAGLGEDGEVSNSEIKSFIYALIKEENRLKPLSDTKIQDEVEKSFKIRIGRRTVTKYRNQAGISGSSDRKKIYTFA